MLYASREKEGKKKGKRLRSCREMYTLQSKTSRYIEKPMFLFLSQFGHKNSSKIQTKSVYTEAEAVCTRLPVCAGPRAVGVRARGAAVDAGKLATRAGARSICAIPEST